MRRKINYQRIARGGTELTVQVARDTLLYMRQAHLVMVASSLAYVTILSIVPALAVAFAIFQAFGGLERLYDVVEPFIIRNLAEAASEQAMAAIRKAVSAAGALGAGGTVFLILTTMSMLYNAEAAINRVWQASNRRPLMQRIAYYWFVITLGPLALAAALGLVGNLGWTRHLPPGGGTFVVSSIVFFLVYKLVPGRHVNWRSALCSALFTACILGAARFGYGVYTKEVVTYNRIYGSLGAVPIILLWIWINWVIVLTGAALGAAVQKRLDLK